MKLAWSSILSRGLLSHPVRVRGLKLVYSYEPLARRAVAPRAGAWIETAIGTDELLTDLRRTPCGCVD